MEIKARDERGQITYSSGPFRGSEAYRDACRSTLTGPRLLTGATVRHTHTLPSSSSLFTFVFFSSCLSVSDACVSPPSVQCVLSLALISLVLARFCMHGLCPLSPIYLAYQFPFMREFFLFFPCLLSACFYFSTVAHYKVLHRKVLLRGQRCFSPR